jgi:hypothetical protein
MAITSNCIGIWRQHDHRIRSIPTRRLLTIMPGLLITNTYCNGSPCARRTLPYLRTPYILRPYLVTYSALVFPAGTGMSGSVGLSLPANTTVVLAKKPPRK